MLLMMMLTGSQPNEVLESLLKQIGQTTDPEAFPLLVQTFRALPAKLTDAQMGQVIEPVLKQIGQTTNPKALQALAQVLEALAERLTDAQAMQASKAAAASLAWAANDQEATEWARALVMLSRPAANRDGMLVNAIAYPAAAGSATEVLLEAMRVGHPDAPPKEEGTEASLEWLANTYPYVLRPPLCPEPLEQQPVLKCPPLTSQQE
jgi:ABC-type transporter Mla subunit MlaD